MATKEELLKKIKKLEDKLKGLNESLEKIYAKEENIVSDRIAKALKGHGDFTLDELKFAATVRCQCGAGMCYPDNISVWGAWYCSSILMGSADRNAVHTSSLPFNLYEVKSETQPSAQGKTTRPQ